MNLRAKQRLKHSLKKQIGKRRKHLNYTSMRKKICVSLENATVADWLKVRVSTLKLRVLSSSETALVFWYIEKVLTHNYCSGTSIDHWLLALHKCVIIINNNKNLIFLYILFCREIAFLRRQTPEPWAFQAFSGLVKCRKGNAGLAMCSH